MIRRTLITTAIAVGIVASGASAASARPVQDNPAYCGPGQSHTVFDHRTGRLVAHCTSRVAVPKRIAVPKPSILQPWRWRF